MIQQIFKDITFFMAILMSIMVSFSAAFFVLYRHDSSAFNTYVDAFLSTFYMLLGDFDSNTFEEAQLSTSATVLFVLYMFAANIVLLNLLIALMGDSYDKIQMDSNAHFLKMKRFYLQIWRSSKLF